MFNVNINSQTMKFISKFDAIFAYAIRMINEHPDDAEWYGRVLPKSFCDYSKKLFMCIVSATFLYTLAAIAISGLITGPLFLFMPDFFDTSGPNAFNVLTFFGTACAGAIIMFGIIVGILGLIAKIHEKIKTNRNYVEKKDSFIKTAYLSWKDKYCPMVNYTGFKKDENHE